MKITGFVTPAIAAFVLAVATTATPVSAQAPATPPPGGRPPLPKPANLKVLPPDLTGDQVMEIMHKWEGMLGTECTTCHAADPNNLMPNGRPRLKYADDSKKEKQVARLMVKMTEDINKNYVSMVEGSSGPVTCGTCHRGHLTPEQFVPRPEHDHDHDHPGADHDHDDHDHPGGTR